MSIKIPGFSKKAMTVLGMLIVIGIGYSYYFFGYVKNNEIAYQQKAYRILDKIGYNIEANNKNNIKNVESIVKTLKEDNSDSFSKEAYKKIDSIITQFDLATQKIESIYSDIESIYSKKDLNQSDYNNIYKLENEIDSLDNKRYKLEELYYEITTDDFDYENPEKFITTKINNFLSTNDVNRGITLNSVNKTSGKKNINNEANNKFIFYEKLLTKKDEYGNSEAWHLLFQKKLSDFVDPLLRKDVFDEFLILRNGDSSLAYQTFNNKLVLGKKDSLFFHKSSQVPLKNNTIIIEKTKYRAFNYNLSFDNHNEQWLLIGCIKEQHYLKEIRSINFWIIINSCLIIIFLIFAMPTLKLALMNSIERLHRRNVFLSGVSIVMGSLFVVLLILMGSNYNNDISKIDERLDSLSNNVKQRFFSELKLASNQLSDFDNAFKTYLNDSIDSYTSKKTKTINNIEDQSEFQNQRKTNIPIIKNKGYSFTSIFNDSSSLDVSNLYLDFSLAFWANAKGEQKAKLFKGTKSTKRINVKNRDYFKAAKNDTLWKIPGIIDELYLQSVMSWTTGTREIIVSKKGSDKKYFPVIAIASKFKSLIDPVLPLGYGFSIIDKDGNVKIHSDSKKNLQENLLNESQNITTIQSAIYGRIDVNSNINYLGSNHRIKITPIDGTPLFLVVFNNLDHLKSKISEVWSTSLFLVFISFFAVFCFMIFVNILRWKSTKLLTKSFFFDWMSPQDSNMKVYQTSIAFNSYAILISIIFFLFTADSPINLIYMIFLLPSMVFVIMYNQLKEFKSKLEKTLFKTSSILFLVFINISFISHSMKIDSEYLMFAIYQILIFLIYKYKLNFGQKINTQFFCDLKITFTSFLMSWLFLTAMVPMFYSYTTSYSIESKLWSKYTLLELNKTIQHQISNKKNNAPNQLNQLHNLNSNSGIYTNFLDVRFNKNDTDFKENTSYKSISNSISNLRPRFNDDIIKNNSLIYTKAVDSSFKWKQKNDTILFTQELSLNNGKRSEIYITQKLDTLNLFKNTSFANLIILVLIFIFTLGVIYSVIMFCVNKIYGLDFRNLHYNSNLTKEILQNNFTIIIGLPFSGKDEILNNFIKENKDIDHFDCTTINHTNDDDDGFISDIWGNSKQKIIILDNFEYNNDHHDTNRKKLRIIEKLKSKGKKIIITSDIEPTEFLDMYNRTLDKEHFDLAIKEGYEHELELWRYMLSDFVEVVIPLTKKEFTFKTTKLDNLLSRKELLSLEEKDTLELELKRKEFKQILSQELVHGSFLHAAYPILLKHLDKKIALVQLTQEDIILEVQNYLKSYYYSIWNALTNKQKIAVYDMCKDNFINTKNKLIINTLLKKGLLCYKNNKIDVMNESFKNFVLTVLTSHEISKMNTEVRKKGKWVNIKTAIILVIFSLVVLIGFGKPDFFRSMNKILVVIAGILTVIPTLTKVFSLTQKIK